MRTVPVSIRTIEPTQPDPNCDPMNVGSWSHRGACRGENTDLWFPTTGVTVTEAKRVCMTCVVRPACAEYALAAKEKFGVWGGLSERERRRIRSERIRAERDQASAGADLAVSTA